MWRRLGALLSGAALLILSRWALRVGRPADDLHDMRRAWERVSDWARDCWSILWRAYGPVTADMRNAWERLRARYHDGAYGAEGT